MDNSRLYNTVAGQFGNAMQPTPKGSECELLAAEDRIYVRVSSAEADLQEICQSAHTEFQWLWNKDDMAYIDHTDVNIVRSD